MKIEDILSAAGIEDADKIKQVAEELPKHFMPTAELNKRVASAKKETEDLQKTFDDYKADVEKTKTEAGDAGDSEAAKALEELQQKYSDLEGKFSASQEAIKARDAKSALLESLKTAGANPAAIELLASNAVSRVEFGEDGKPSNVSDICEALKTDNEGLFGAPVDTGKPAEKADEENKLADAFKEGFGETERK